MLLQKSYVALHLTDESEKILFSSLWSLSLEAIEGFKEHHITLDFYWSPITEDIFSTHIERIQKNIYHILQNTWNIGTISSPSHFKSDVSGEDIFYLPVNDTFWFFKELRSSGCSIRTPHITLLIGNNLSQDKIIRTLKDIQDSLSLQEIKIDTENIFGHGTYQDGRKIVQKRNRKSM